MDAAYKYVRYLAYFIEIIVLYIVEQVPNFVPGINGAKPLIVLPVVIVVALFEGEKAGLAFGFLTGLLLDISSTGRIGFYTMVLALVAFFVAILARYTIESLNFVNVLVGCAVAVAVVYALHFLVMFVIKGHKELIYALTNYYFFGALYTLLMAPVIYFFNRALAINIRRGE